MNPKQLMDEYEINPKKSLGQNFMHDPNTLEKIIETAELMPDDTVVEIGPGTGSITELLAEAVRHVVAIEVDLRLQPILEERFEDTNNVYFVFNDVLKTDILQLVGPKEFVVVANVPYYITSAILRHLLEPYRKPRTIVMTVQQEVADRLIAEAGDMSLLAVSVQFYGKPKVVTRLKPAVFWPRPDVDSAVIKIDTYDTPPVDVPDDKIFFRVVRAGFSMKRKQLKNSLSGGLGIKSKIAGTYLEEAGIEPKRRAETLSLEEWAALTRVIAAHEGG